MIPAVRAEGGAAPHIRTNAERQYKRPAKQWRPALAFCCLMSTHPISNEVQKFIVRYIETVEQLEVLSLLAENPSTMWSVPEVFRKIQSSEKSVREILGNFVRTGLAVEKQAERYQFPEESEAATQAAAAVAAYRQRPVTVIECIYKKPSTSIQGFADAFKLKRET